MPHLFVLADETETRARLVTEEEWQRVRQILPQTSPLGRPQTVCRRAIVDAILYRITTRCGWRDLPHHFPHWSSVYGYYRRWHRDGTLDAIGEVLNIRVNFRAA